MAHQPPLSLGILQARILQWVAMPSSRGSSQPRGQTWVSRMQADSLPSEPLGKPRKTGVGSLSLLQGHFLTQEWNWGLLYCRWILYQLSHQGSPQFTCFCDAEVPLPKVLLSTPNHHPTPRPTTEAKQPPSSPEICCPLSQPGSQPKGIWRAPVHSQETLHLSPGVRYLYLTNNLVIY